MIKTRGANATYRALWADKIRSIISIESWYTVYQM